MKTPLPLEAQVLAHGEGLGLPAYETAGAAGMDLRAALPAEAPVRLEPGSRTAIPTGLALAIPPGFEGQVRARSGLARRHGIGVVNAPGTIDSDYRGEIHVLLVNLGEEAVDITRGMRIAQLVIAPVVQATLLVKATLPASDRGAGGFGSTGMDGHASEEKQAGGNP